MSRLRMQLAAGALAILAGVLAARAQQAPNTAHVGYVFPAGGQQGATVEVVLGGQYLEGATDVLVSGTGVTASVAEYYKPINFGQYNYYRDQVKILTEKKAAANATQPASRPATTSKATTSQPATAASQPATRPTWTAADEARLASYKLKILTPPKRIENPALGETVTLQVTIDASAPCGQRELRLLTPAGLTNPMRFRVGSIPEHIAKDIKITSKTPPAAIALPAIVNGQIMPGGVDRFKVKAKKGQELIVAVAARELIPYLSDAVPGWFQATVQLLDSRGQPVAFAGNFRFQPDPVIHYTVPADDEYTVEIRDSIYRGREDFVYRATIGDVPFVTDAYPLGGKVDTQTKVALSGWNLPKKSVTFDARGKSPGIHALSVPGVEGNRIPFAVDALPEMTLQGGHGDVSSAQDVTLPSIINGRIERSGQWQVFKFDAAEGDQVVAEVTARRLNSPLDSILRITDASGKQLAISDDQEDKGAGLETHHADSYILTKIPATGTYYVYLGDVQRRGGPEYAFRLRLSKPQPDFALRVTPASVTSRTGANVPLTVYALRKDGFTGDITLSLKDAPAGFSLAGATIPAAKESVSMTLKPASKTPGPLTLAFEGKATLDGRTITRMAAPADDMMQAFLYRHLVTSQDFVVNVQERWMARGGARVTTKMPLKIPAGSNTSVKTSLPISTFMGKIEMELADPCDGFALKDIAPNKDGSEITLQTDAAMLPPGTKGNLVVNIYLVREAGPEAQRAKRRMPLGTLPAITYEITER